MRHALVALLFSTLVLVGCNSDTPPPASSSPPPMVASSAPATESSGSAEMPAAPASPATEASAGPAVPGSRPPGLLQFQKQLNLTEEQMQKIDKIRAAHQKDRDRQAALQEVEQILTPEQKEKFEAMRAGAKKRQAELKNKQGGEEGAQGGQ